MHAVTSAMVTLICYQTLQKIGHEIQDIGHLQK